MLKDKLTYYTTPIAWLETIGIAGRFEPSSWLETFQLHRCLNHFQFRETGRCYLSEIIVDVLRYSFSFDYSICE